MVLFSVGVDNGRVVRCEGGHRYIPGKSQSLFLKQSHAMTAPWSIDPSRFLSEGLDQASTDLLRQMLQTFNAALLRAMDYAVCGLRSAVGVSNTNGPTLG